MYKRFVATTVLAVALLTSQGANFLIGSLCPHVQSATASCESQLSEPSMSHHDMGHMQMDAAETEPGQNLDPDGVFLGKPIGSCSHCAVHSGTTSNAISLRDVEAAKHAGDLSIPLTFSRFVPVTASPVTVLTSRAHGPPGESPSRYILLSVFRI
jgi:hypothetical protein